MPMFPGASKRTGKTTEQKIVIVEAESQNEDIQDITMSDLDKFEVTKSLWNEVRSWATKQGYVDLPPGSGAGEHHPVHTLTWYEAVKW